MINIQNNTFSSSSFSYFCSFYIKIYMITINPNPAFKKAKSYQNLKVGQNKDLVGYRKKKSFRQCAWGLRQLVLKPGFSKSQTISTAADQYFLSYVKKLQGGQIDPPPTSMNRVKITRRTKHTRNFGSLDSTLK